jgi:hypothetical protein
MTQSTRKLVGTLLTLVVLVAWAGVATAIYVTWLTGLPSPVLLAYFAIAGLGWALPVARIIRWMARPDRV